MDKTCSQRNILKVNRIVEKSLLSPSERVISVSQKVLKYIVGSEDFEYYFCPHQWTNRPIDEEEIPIQGLEALYHYFPRLARSYKHNFYAGESVIGLSLYKVNDGVFFITISTVDLSTSVLCISKEEQKEERMSEAIETLRKLVLHRIYNRTLSDVILPVDLKKDVQDEVQTFLQSRALYADLKLPWKRGIVFYGPPGNGKTMLIKAIAGSFSLPMENIKDSIEQDGSLVLKKPYDTLFYEDYPTLYYLEDIDKFVAFQGENDYSTVGLHQLLQGLDGVNEISGALIVATTNNPNELVEALMNRPGRFDRVFRIAPPTRDLILELFKKYNFEVEDDGNLQAAKSLEGCSMSHAEEFVKACLSNYKSRVVKKEEALNILDRIKSHSSTFKSHFIEPSSYSSYL